MRVAKRIAHLLKQDRQIGGRMQMRRFTRLSNGFSKKLENLKAAVALHFCHYNFMRLHGSTRVTPAMAAGIEDRLWTLQELAEETSK